MRTAFSKDAGEAVGGAVGAPVIGVEDQVVEMSLQLLGAHDRIMVPAVQAATAAGHRGSPRSCRFGMQLAQHLASVCAGSGGR